MAARLNRSTKTFRKYVDEYDIPHVRLGRDLLFDRAEVEAYLKAETVKRRQKRYELAKPKRRHYSTPVESDKYAQLLGLAD